MKLGLLVNSWRTVEDMTIAMQQIWCLPITKPDSVPFKKFFFLLLAQAFERMMSPTTAVPVSDISEHCSTVPPLQEVQASGTPNSPSVSVSTSVHQKPDDDSKLKKRGGVFT